MKILGINHSNDSAAALIEEGLVTRASAEERFTRRKHDSAFPHHAKSFVLSHLDGVWRIASRSRFFGTLSYTWTRETVAS